MRFFILLLLCSAALRVQAAADSLRVSDLTANPPVTKTLNGQEAARVLNAFERLPWDQTQGMRCHHPAFRIERLAGDTVLLEATICFGCNNVRFRKPEGKGTQGFDASKENAKSFHTMLEELFR
jgi:hypothetical protein